MTTATYQSFFDDQDNFRKVSYGDVRSLKKFLNFFDCRGDVFVCEFHAVPPSVLMMLLHDAAVRSELAQMRNGIH